MGKTTRYDNEPSRSHKKNVPLKKFKKEKREGKEKDED